VVSCQDEKSQIKNREKGMRVLRARLYEVEGKRYTGTTQWNGRFFADRLTLVAGLDFTHRDVGPAKVRDYFVVPLPGDENNAISLRIKMDSYSGFVQGDLNPIKVLKLDYGARIAKEDFATVELLNHAAVVYSPVSGSSTCTPAMF
jgi:hypothetical protein